MKKNETQTIRIYVAILTFVLGIFIYAGLTGWLIINTTDSEHTGKATHSFYNHK